MINKLKSAPSYKGAQGIDISIAVGTNAQDKNWKTKSIAELGSCSLVKIK